MGMYLDIPKISKLCSIQWGAVGENVCLLHLVIGSLGVSRHSSLVCGFALWTKNCACFLLFPDVVEDFALFLEWSFVSLPFFVC